MALLRLHTTVQNNNVIFAGEKCTKGGKKTQRSVEREGEILATQKEHKREGKETVHLQGGLSGRG